MKIANGITDHVEQTPNLPRAPHPDLTLTDHCATLQASERSRLKWRLTPNLRPRMNRVNTLRLKLLSKKCCLSRTRLSRLNSTPRSECGNSAGSGLPATLPVKRIRNSFRPPCQSPPRRSTASPQSAIKLTETDLHRSLCSRGFRDC